MAKTRPDTVRFRDSEKSEKVSIGTWQTAAVLLKSAVLKKKGKKRFDAAPCGKVQKWTGVKIDNWIRFDERVSEDRPEWKAREIGTNPARRKRLIAKTENFVLDWLTDNGFRSLKGMLSHMKSTKNFWKQVVSTWPYLIVRRKDSGVSSVFNPCASQRSVRVIERC